MINFFTKRPSSTLNKCVIINCVAIYVWVLVTSSNYDLVVLHLEDFDGIVSRRL